METIKSNKGENGQIPEELKTWNWGAFILSWIWGIVHNVWVALLALVPFILWIIIYVFTKNEESVLLLFITPIMMIVLGIKGNEWAWKNNKWIDNEHFINTQKKWRNWAIAILILFTLLVVLGALYFMISVPVEH